MQKIEADPHRAVIVYVPSEDNAFEALEDSLSSALISVNLEAFHDFKALSRRFRRMNRGIAAAVLLLPTKGDVEDMLSIHALLDGVPLVLVLHERDRETISKAHRLGPRYIAEIGSGYQDIVAVLVKMTMAKKTGTIPVETVGRHLDSSHA